MKKVVLLILMSMLIAVGCSKKNDEAASPSPSATVTASPTVSPAATGTPAASPGATPGNTGGGTVSATPAPTPTIAPEKLTAITKEQADKLEMNTKLDDLVKAVGQIQPIQESNGKKIYELRISDQPNYFVQISYFSDGSMSEKKVYMR